METKLKTKHLQQFLLPKNKYIGVNLTKCVHDPYFENTKH